MLRNINGWQSRIWSVEVYVGESSGLKDIPSITEWFNHSGLKSAEDVSSIPTAI